MRVMRTLALIVVGILCLGAAKVAHATATADASLSFDDLLMAPASGVLTLDGPWLLQVFPAVNNTLGETDAKFDFAFSPGLVSQTATVTWATAAASASAPNDPPDFVVSATASGNVDIPACVTGGAFAAGDALLTNSFTLSGTGDVNVDFGADIAGALHVATSLCGVSAFSETIFNFQIDGNPVLFDHRVLSIGPNDADSLVFATHLSASVLLATGISHSLSILVDAEPSALNIPEPGTILLLVALAPSLWWGLRRGRQRSRTR